MNQNDVVSVPSGALTVATGISILPVLSLAPTLVPFENAAAELEDQLSRAVIDSDEAYAKGSEFLSLCAHMGGQLETLRKSVKGPIDDYGKLIQTMFLPKLERFKAAGKTMSERMLAYHQAAEARRREAEEKTRRAQEEAALALAAEQEAKGDTAGAGAILEAATVQPATRAPPRKIGGSNSMGRSTHVAVSWEGRVAEPMVTLKAIIDGKLPITILEWRHAELNRIARDVGVEGVHSGIKVSKVEGLRQR